jgi:two-component system CitB family sensor kinase
LVFTDGWSTKKPPAHGKRGIGLSLVRRLAERQGGRAQVAEADGGGAEFIIVLPETLAEPGLAPQPGLARGPRLVPDSGPPHEAAVVGSTTTKEESR